MGKFYAVRNGRQPGIYSNWTDCKNQVSGYSQAQFKSFPTREAAEAYARGGSAPTSGAGSSRSYHSRTSTASTPYSAKGGSRTANRIAQINSSSYSSNSGSRGTLDRTVVYTDGSSLGNGRHGAKAGWASYWGANDPRNTSGPVRTGEQTNNRGELIAIHETLKTIDAESRGGTEKGYRIMADSHYARDSLDKWTKNWAANGWKTSSGTDVKNRDIIEPAYTLLNDLRGKGVPVEIDYVPAHSGHAGNEAADQMARSAAEKS